MKTPRKLLILGTTLLVAGFVVTVPFAYFWNQNRLAAANPEHTIMVPAVAPLPAEPAVITGKPTLLQIPSLAIELPIADGVYNDQTHTWSLSSNKAHYALPSVQPNDASGNTFIYGHYRPEVFARLHKIVAGAEVRIVTDNGHTFIYRYQGNETVDPSNTDVFAYEGAPRLTIQTCTGTWMQNRQLFYFEFVSVQ